MLTPIAWVRICSVVPSETGGFGSLARCRAVMSWVEGLLSEVVAQDEVMEVPDFGDSLEGLPNDMF